MWKTGAFFWSLAFIVATAAITGRVVSQDASREDDTWKYSVPSKQHDLLERIAGKWEQNVKFWSSPDAQPETTRLTADYRWLFGGRFLIGNHEGYVAGELLQAKEVLGYDSYRQEFNSFWIDNKTTAFILAKGQYDKSRNALVLEGLQDDVERNIRDQKFRFIYRFINDDEMVIEVFRPGEGGRMFKRAEVTSTRVE